MVKAKNIFLKKKILIYGLGKSGISTFKFLKDKAKVYLFDDNSKINLKLINIQKIEKKEFDFIIISPGIDISNCKLSKFLKKNFLKIYTDLDVFYSFYKKNMCITITGTNGKSTTAKILYDVLFDQKKDVRLVGNIGNPILSEKNIKKKTIFVIEASSYQLDYSRLFTSKYAAILNISADHIERHKTLKNYINAKFKLLDYQIKGCFSFVKKGNEYIEKKIKSKKFECKIIKVNTKQIDKFIKNIDNEYFSSEANQENLSFVVEISKKLNLKKDVLIDTIRNFKGLKYRQQIIFKNEYLTIINDSKSTSFSSSISLLKVNPNIFWLLGGVHKKGDKFDLSKRYFKNIKAFIFGKDKKFFNKKLHKKIEYRNFNNLKDALKKILIIVKNKKFKHQTILFSPCAASFDSFKNFEDRGNYFNNLIKKHLNEIQNTNL